MDEVVGDGDGGGSGGKAAAMCGVAGRLNYGLGDDRLAAHLSGADGDASTTTNL